MSLHGRREVTNPSDSRTVLERPAIAGDSPVYEIRADFLEQFLSTTGHVKPCRNLGGPSSKAKYYSETDSERVP
jgi:hypothetical protein